MNATKLRHGLIRRSTIILLCIMLLTLCWMLLSLFDDSSHKIDSKGRSISSITIAESSLNHQKIDSSNRSLEAVSSGSNDKTGLRHHPDRPRPPRVVYKSRRSASLMNREYIEGIRSIDTQAAVAATAPPAPSGYANKLGMNTVLLVICSNRPEYIKRTLSYILSYHPKTAIPIVISQDGDHPAVNAVIDEFIDRFVSSASTIGRPIATIKHIKHIPTSLEARSYENGYFALAAHFKFALDSIFRSEGNSQPIQRVIILEEDLQIAPDFFDYFAAMMDLLDNDTSLLAVSAWNDNGMKGMVQDAQQFYRSDFFPGLGWMLTRRIWVELSIKWPRAYWDDWLREPKQRLNRQFIRPEICRSFHFGMQGVSNAQYSEYLNSIQLNNQLIDYQKLDLSYLQQDKWDGIYVKSVMEAPVLSLHEFHQQRDSYRGKAIRILYQGNDDYPMIALPLGAMDNIKAGVPRTAYKGIVTIWKNGVKVHLVPSGLSS